MAPFGKIFTKERNPRTTAILAIAKANGIELDVEHVDTVKPTPEFLKFNPLSKVPTFVGSDGYVLTESIAVAIYITSQNEKTTLLGKTKQDYASILKWCSYFNMEVLPNLGAWYRPLLGWDAYNKKAVEDAEKKSAKVLDVVEEHLLHNTFLVGERITLADLFAVSIAARGFQFFFDTKWRQAHPNISRWYETVYNQDIFTAVAPKFELLSTPALTNVAPKKAEQPKKEKPAAAPKAAAAAADDEEDDKPAEPKPKHPLEALPRASFPIDEWKRYYSNNEVDESLKWFWDNIPFNEYSLWKVTYKYPEDLTLTFMSGNLIGGFFNRLEASRKYIFGGASVFGKSNDSVIEGAFLIRGEDYLAAFDVAPDYESYSYEKLDPTNPEHKQYVIDQWRFDESTAQPELPKVTQNGKEYVYSKTGKVFK